MNWPDFSRPAHSIALCSATILLAALTLGGCGDNTNTPSPSSWLEERAAAAEDGSIRIANRALPGPDDFDPIGTPHDSLGELQSSESCFSEAAVTDPKVTIRRSSSVGSWVTHVTPQGITDSVNSFVLPDFSIEDPATQLDLPYLRSGESFATVVSRDYRETAYVSADWSTTEGGNYNDAICGSEESPLTLAEFNARCGDRYTDGSLMGGFRWLFAVHPTMSADELDAVRDDFAAGERGGFFSSAENIEMLVDLGFDVRVYSYGFPDTVADASHVPGSEISPQEARAYFYGGNDFSDNVAEAINQEPAWPHDKFGAVLGQGKRPYKQLSIQECTQRDARSELTCYTNQSYVALSSRSDWQGYLQTAEQRLANPSQFDWGYDPEGVRADYQTFVQDVRSCLDRTEGVWSECRGQIDATPTDTDAICSSCAIRFNCDPMASNAEQCADAPERERFECDAGAFHSEWDRLDERVQPRN